MVAYCMLRAIGGFCTESSCDEKKAGKLLPILLSRLAVSLEICGKSH